MSIPGFVRRFQIDERFIMHRYKSTSHASMAGASMLGGWFFYDLIKHDVIRNDLLIILGTMVAVKIGFMIYYGTRD